MSRTLLVSCLVIVLLALGRCETAADESSKLAPENQPSQPAQNEQPADEPAENTVTVTGLLVDLFCWDDLSGIALDTGENLKLFPMAHTVHCLVEVGVCRKSGFAIVEKPKGSKEYVVAYVLDDAGNDKATELMLEIPKGRQRWRETGYELTVTGTVTPSNRGGESSMILQADPASMSGNIPDPKNYS